ncbi:MAG: hypothetical protein J1F12_04940 [Muribaculaceae bacterium]|nr:hypothetical protein [Muribaculaceae bacterium]
MKKINKYFTIAATLGMGLLGLSSCDESKGVEYDPANPLPRDRVVYFGEEAETYFELIEDDNTVIFPVYRNYTDGELRVPIKVTPAENYEGESAYSFPSEVVFADGSDFTTYTVTYDYDKAEKGEEQTYFINLDETYSSPYVLDYLSVTLVKPAWAYYGDVYFADYFIEVEGTFRMYQNEMNTAQYRIEAPYFEATGDSNSYFVFQLMEEGEDYEVDYFGDLMPLPITGPNQVGYQLCLAYSMQGYDFYAAMSDVWGENGLGYIPTTNEYNYVVDYQADGVTPNEIHLSPIYISVETAYLGDLEDYLEQVVIVFPGGTASDTTLELEVEGFTQDYDELIVNLTTVGADLTSVKLAVGEGTNADAVISAIEDGSLASIEVTKAGTVNVPFPYSDPGRYTLAAVGYVNDEPRTQISGTVTFTTSDEDSNAGWKSLGYVNYTDGYMCANPFYFIERTTEKTVLTYQVEIQEYTEEPGLYRLVNPYGEAYPYNDPGDYDPNWDCYVYIDATVPDQVVVLASEQTLDWGDFGLAFTLSWADYYLTYEEWSVEEVAEEDYFGSLSGGKITFPAQALAAQWIFTTSDLEEYSDYIFGANVVMDWETYQANGANENADPFLKNPDGTLYAPFCVDLNSLTQTPTPSTRSMGITNGYKYLKTKSMASAKHGVKLPKKTISSKKKTAKKLQPKSIFDYKARK